MFFQAGLHSRFKSSAQDFITGWNHNMFTNTRNGLYVLGIYDLDIKKKHGLYGYITKIDNCSYPSIAFSLVLTHYSQVSVYI